MARALVYAAFVASGVAGLAYEVVWSRYLSLFVGHGAYAQVLVLAVYLGGMALGSLLVAERSRRLARPLVAYAAAEGVLAVAALAFHPVFTAVTGLAYDHLFPALGSPGLVGGVRWGLAALLVLPQAVVLGTTFPLMAAGLVRLDGPRPGRGVATVYLLNTLGGAAGVLLAGFAGLAWLGLPGTLVAAGALSAAAGLLAWRVGGTLPTTAHGADGVPGAVEVEVPQALAGWDPTFLLRAMVAVSLGTAVASFAYEIGWIRMLSLVLGSATHAFELMLSAFILGLALGAWLIRSRVDRSPDPVRLLGFVQVLMGLAAVATLPLYLASFDAVAWMVGALPARDDGWLLFNLGRYGLCLAVMLPSTVLAGTTLPLVTGALLRAGHGERSIGLVYGWNTVGSVLGVGLAGLVLLPWLGLEGLLLAGAALDVALGVGLLHLSGRLRGAGSRPAFLAAATATVTLLVVGSTVSLEGPLLTSGVFRTGRIPEAGTRRVLYHEDGRTATVAAWVGLSDGLVVLSTNGKPDASMGPRWLAPRSDTLPPTPLPAGRDFTTQVLAPLVGLAHVPDARTVANVGHGSGMTGVTLLGSPAVERLVNVEIERRMVEGSFVFLPANQAVFEDPRSTFVFDDAKSYFAHRQERFDLVFAEPSNPWVSGTASLFTEEFYRRIRSYLSDDGVLAQWMQLYELDDDLFLSMLAALDRAFPRYRAYLVGAADLVVVAGGEDAVLEPDWSVLGWDGVQAILSRVPPFRPEHMAALYVFDQDTFRPLLDDPGLRANSDYRPVVDAGAERARFLGRFAEGLYSFASNRVELVPNLEGARRGPVAYRRLPALGVEPLETWTRAAWMREALATGGAATPTGLPEWGDRLIQLGDFLAMASSPPVNEAEWLAWARLFDRTERGLHWGTVGWADSTFYGAVYRTLEAGDPPAEARASVDLLHGTATQDWGKAAAAAEVLLGPVSDGEGWVRPTVLLDVSVIANLRLGRPAMARRAWALLQERTDRAPWNLRNRYLERVVRDAEGAARRAGATASPGGP